MIREGGKQSGARETEIQGAIGGLVPHPLLLRKHTPVTACAKTRTQEGKKRKGWEEKQKSKTEALIPTGISDDKGHNLFLRIHKLKNVLSSSLALLCTLYCIAGILLLILVHSYDLTFVYL